MKYLVNQPMLHGNQPYAEGDTVEMTDAQAEFLRLAGFIQPAEPAAEPAKPAKKAKDEAGA